MDEADALADALLACRRGAIIAAAGCGKTYLISLALRRATTGRELVLTHTHAGVDAIRRRLRKMRVPPTSYRVDTIAGWALRYATAFPKTSGVAADSTPTTSDEWNAVYDAAAGLLRRSFVREIVRRSYAGVFVDEYQDCTVQQHALVLAMAEIIPCRVLGDPLQGIFNFGGHKPVRWDDHVDPHFEKLPRPDRPWRWQSTNPQLGTWLQGVRSALCEGREIDLRDGPANCWRHLPSDDAGRIQAQDNACFDLARHDGESVVAIRRWTSECHLLASRLNGAYSCVEPIDCEDLFTWAERIAEATGYARAVAVIDFAAKGMSRIKTEMSTIRKALAAGRVPKVKKHQEQLDALLAVARTDSVAPVTAALEHLRRMPGVSVYRRELLHEMKRALRECCTGGHETPRKAAWHARNRTRLVGRRLARRCIGTTLLVKGLEFDHALVLDADSLDRENLYVAMTRGAKSLTILSRCPILAPGVGKGGRRSSAS